MTSVWLCGWMRVWWVVVDVVEWEVFVEYPFGKCTKGAWPENGSVLVLPPELSKLRKQRQFRGDEPFVSYITFDFIQIVLRPYFKFSSVRSNSTRLDLIRFDSTVFYSV